METGCVVGVLGSVLLAGAAAAQPMDVIASQPPAPDISSQASQRLTGVQTFEPARVLVDDFVADRDSVLERVRLFAAPTGNAYAIRLRVLELNAANGVVAEIASTTPGIARAVSDAPSGDPGVVAYDIDIPGGVGLRDGTRYGIEAVGLLVAPSLGDAPRQWRWAGATGDGGVLIETQAGLVRLDHPGVAFELLGEILTPACVADVNQDGLLTPADFSAWIIAYNARDPRADQNGDGAITPADYNAWILNFSAGC